MAVLIHGMWGTSAVWRNWRPLLEERGWETIADTLRYHDAAADSPPAALGETSLHDYVADLETTILALPEKPVVIGHSMGGLIALLLCARGLARAGVLLTPAPPSSVIALRPSNLMAFARIQARWAWWRKPHRATLREALTYTFNTSDPVDGTTEHAGFVHESGRALLEIGMPWLDDRKAATVDPRRVTVPLLFVRPASFAARPGSSPTSPTMSSMKARDIGCSASPAGNVSPTRRKPGSKGKPSECLSSNFRN